MNNNMKIGDFVEIEYVGRVLGTNEIFDLTSAKIAKKEGIFNPKQTYKPVLVVIGAHMIISGVENQLMQMRPGEEREFEVKPKQGFGYRDPKLIKIISRSKFIHDKVNPVPGTFVKIDNKQAKIQSVSGGRVRVDFNHPLAGKQLKYKLKIVNVIKTPLEKSRALLLKYSPNCDAVKIDKGTLTIKSEKLNPLMKKFINKIIKKWIKEVKIIKFINTDFKKK
jgi:FKBP-type peptidyl-prolyl cis-trans isomerase 2